MSVVQPVLITELIFVLVLRRVWIHQNVAHAAWAAVFVVCVSLAVFLAAAEPTGGQPAPDTAEWLSAGLPVRRGRSPPGPLGPRGPPPRAGPRLSAGAPPAPRPRGPP